jgi:NADH:ubiquinone oxidoreductase subunit H
MNPILEASLVGLIVVTCVLVVLRALLPFAARVWIARHLQGRVPDRVLVWIAGRQGCEACGGRPPPLSRR